MYDYLDHWCWLMNQLSKKTREIWRKHRLNFRILDRATMTVLHYAKELDKDAASLLANSSLLSCMDVCIELQSDESFGLLSNILHKLAENHVVPIEV